MPIYALPAYDELGQAIQFPLEGTSEGYESFAVDDNGTLVALASEPEEAPPDGELPFYDEDGTTLLGTFPFAPFGEVLGDQLSYASFVQGATEALRLSLVEGLRLPVLWENSGSYYDPESNGLGNGYAAVRFEPGELRVIGFGDGFIRMRARMSVLIDVHEKLERGSGDVLSRVDSVFSQYTLPLNAELLGWSYSTVRNAPAAAGTGPTYIYRILAEHEFPIAVAVPDRVGSTLNASPQLVEPSIQSTFEARVTDDAVEHANWSNVDRAGVALWASTTVDHGIETGGRIAGTRTRRRDGRLSVTLGVPIESGTLALWQALDRFVSGFTKATVEGAVFELPSATVLGVDGSSYQLQVECAFSVEEPR